MTHAATVAASTAGGVVDDDELLDLLYRSLYAVHQANTGRPVRCMDCNVTFLNGLEGLEHLRQHSRSQHPSARGQR